MLLQILKNPFVNLEGSGEDNWIQLSIELVISNVLSWIIVVPVVLVRYIETKSLPNGPTNAQPVICICVLSEEIPITSVIISQSLIILVEAVALVKEILVDTLPPELFWIFIFSTKQLLPDIWITDVFTKSGIIP